MNSNPGWQRRLIRRAFRGDGYYTGGTTPSRRVMFMDPAQIPATLMEPAMDAGHPPESVPPMSLMSPGRGNATTEYATRTAGELAPDIETGLNAMARNGWRLAFINGDHYIFERTASGDLHER